MIELPFFIDRIESLCRIFPPEGNEIPRAYKKAAAIEIVIIRILSMAAFAIHFEILNFVDATMIWYVPTLGWWIFFISANTDAYFKIYEEYWEVRLKKKLTLTQAVGKITLLWIDHAIAKHQKKRKK